MSFGLRIFLTTLPLAIIIVGVVGAFVIVKEPGRFPLRFIEIQNELKWVPINSITEVVSPYLDQGFFGIDVETVQKELNNLAWVANSRVQRVWPDKISMTITEQNPLARFAERGVLSTEGKIFYPDLAVLPAGIPWFRGPEKAALEMLKQYLDFLEMLSPLGLSIAELSLSEDGVYKIMLDNGIAIILGKAALSERLGRFVLVYPSQLKKEIKKIAYLDLRYTNGMAVGWKAKVNSSMSNSVNMNNRANTLSDNSE